MSEFVTGIVQTQLEVEGTGAKQQLTPNTQNGRSFENVLQENGSPDLGEPTTRLEDPKLESRRQELIERYQNLPEGVPKLTAILPDYLDTKAKFSDFRSYLNEAVKSVGSMPKGSGVQGTFSAVEEKWMNLTGVMQSGKDLSQGELLALQAGLYQVSQHIEVLSKVVDQMTSGVKTVLNTNI